MLACIPGSSIQAPRAGERRSAAASPPSVTFSLLVLLSISSFSAASQYHLCVGPAGPGSVALFNQNSGSQQSRTVSGIPTDGRTVYVRFWSLTSSWLCRDYTFNRIPLMHMSRIARGGTFLQ